MADHATHMITITAKRDLEQMMDTAIRAGADAVGVSRIVCEYMDKVMDDVVAAAEDASRKAGADMYCPECNWPKRPWLDENGNQKVINGEPQFYRPTTFGGNLVHPCDSGCCNAQYCTECGKFWYLKEMTDDQAEHYKELVKDEPGEAVNERKDGEAAA